MISKVLLSLLVLVAVASAEDNTSSTVPPKTTTTPKASTPVANTTTTVAPVNTTTTVAPTTTTVAPTTTTVAPATTTPAPKPNNYTVSDGNVTCVMMEALIDYKITYEKSVGGKKSNDTVTVRMPTSFSTAGSSCSAVNGTEQILKISFFTGWELEVTFKKAASKSNSVSYNIGEMQLTYVLDATHFPDATMAGDTKTVKTASTKGFVSASSDGYYVCNAQSTFDLGNEKLLTRDFKYMAFNEKAGPVSFSGDATECSADEDTNSIVPIAVGAALAGLVVIVLIAYLIGRKRTRKTGYESV